ncbi:hypothetical protein STAN_3992 [Streptomyces sp. CBMAI 2042]|nr:hypothetical protein STAN_3992 [Streptomyces sp. CBMAI 2042]
MRHLAGRSPGVSEAGWPHAPAARRTQALRVHPAGDDAVRCLPALGPEKHGYRSGFAGITGAARARTRGTRREPAHDQPYMDRAGTLPGERRRTRSKAGPGPRRGYRARGRRILGSGPATVELVERGSPSRRQPERRSPGRGGSRLGSDRAARQHG